jgi:putative ABC transport system permease protein
MKTILIAFRSIFKKGKNNLIKIISLGVGLAVGLVLIAKVFYEQSYDDFFPDSERIYRIHELYLMEDKLQPYHRVSGGVAPGLKAEIAEIETATRITNIGEENTTFLTLDKRKYKGNFYLADTCLFDMFPQNILVGDPKDVLARPMYAMVSKKIANRMGGVDAVMGKTIEMNSFPGETLTIGGVFEDLPLNSHLDYNVLVSMPSISHFMRDGSNGWFGNDRYSGYLKLRPGVTPESLKTVIRQVEERNAPMEMVRRMGGDLNYTLHPLLELHSGTDETKRFTNLLSILAFALLFTAMMNYILIVISSLVSRSKEMAVNKCFGASGTDIYGKMLAETLADLVAAILLAAFVVILFRDKVEDLLDAPLLALFNWRSGLLLAGVCLLMFLVSGFVPGNLFARVPVASAFRRYSENKRFWKLGLLFMQIVAAGFLMTLLVIIIRQYNYMLHDNPGYAYEQVAYCNLRGTNAATRQQAINELKRLPEVAEVTSAYQILMDGASGNNIGLPGDDREYFNIADLYWVSNGYLSFMEIPVIEGRSFQEDVALSHEVMVNRGFVEKMKLMAGWTDGAVGKKIIISEHSNEKDEAYTICGVFEDFRIGYIGNDDMRPITLFYRSAPSGNILIKYHKQTPEANQRVAQVLEGLMPDRDVVVYSYAAEMEAKYVDARKFRDAVMIGSLVTLIITLIGLIGYTKDEMSRRRKETAIRKVNGATLADILRMYMTDVSRIALPALILGGGISAYVAMNWQEQFSEKTSLSPLIFLLSALAVLVVVLGAVAINCYNAANENPALSIKSE